MKKAAIVLIVLSVVVVAAASYFLSGTEEATFERLPDNATLRTTTSGDVVGFIDKYGARSWQGIPFARPPVDKQRWRAPQPPVPADERLVALNPGQLCPQFSSLLSGGSPTGGSSVTGEEDCLYLNIWSPPNAANLPVMFWIHGGGNTIGHGGSYNGSALAADRQVVVVTINYRLGVFGWFNHPELHTGQPLEDSGNYGTLDIVRALEWVRANIREFGGDADNVTVFGESAGGFNTLAMMASPQAKGLFHRAIVQSGGFFPQSLAQAQNYEADGGHPFSSREIVAKLLVADGTVPNHEAAVDYAAGLNPLRLREYLYNKPAAEFFRIFDGGGFGMINVPDSFGDGHVIPATTTREIFSNQENHNVVPVILGTNRDEPSIFMVRNPQYVDTWLGFIPRLKDEATYSRIVKYGALAWKERGVDSLAQMMRNAGNPNVYAYRFDWDEEPSQLGFDLSKALGAGHGLEIAFAFDEFEGGLNLSYIYPNDDAQYALADSMTSYWTQFAYTGDPGSGRNQNEPAWLAWGTDGKHSILLDTAADGGIRMSDEVVTIDSVKAELAADTGFPNPEDQCAVYVRNFRFNFDESEYHGLNPECRNLDPAQFAGF